MADVDPLGILNSELKLRQEDGKKRRANEQVVRQYMNFGNEAQQQLRMVDTIPVLCD